LEKGSYVAASGSMAQERAMDIISNNLANVNTPGFKGDRLLFESYLKRSANSESSIPTSEQIKRGSITPSTEDSEYLVTNNSYTNFEQGSLKMTEQQTDLALTGEGFLSVWTPGGERFTRGGTFKIADSGELVNHEGFPLLGTDNKPVYVGDQSFFVKTDGEVTDIDNNNIGRLKVVDFEDKSQLKKSGNNVFEASNMATMTSPKAEIQQGYLEMSNVNPVSEMTRMITTLRTYQSMQKTIQSEDEMTTRLISDVGRP